MCLAALVQLHMPKWQGTIIEPHNTEDSQAIIQTW